MVQTRRFRGGKRSRKVVYIAIVADTILLIVEK